MTGMNTSNGQSLCHACLSVRSASAGTLNPIMITVMIIITIMIIITTTTIITTIIVITIIVIVIILKDCETLSAAQCGALDQNLLPDVTFLQLDSQRGPHEEALFAKSTPSR